MQNQMDEREISNLAKQCYAASELRNQWEECINFALHLLDNGVESENVYILAGLDSKNKDDIKKYFKLLSDELNVYGLEDDLDFSFLCYLNRKIKNNALAPTDVVDILCSTYFQTLKKIYYEWVEFGETISLLDEGISLYAYNIDKKNLDAYITEKLQLDIELCKMNIPEDFFKMAFCEKCGALVVPLVRTKKSIFRKKHYFVCSNCKSKSGKFKWCRDNEGKKSYLKYKCHL